jgi:putative tryptophan/tyrosine transport system substrate-binding protein
MDRRAFVTGIGAFLATPFAADAQRAGKVWRIGVLGASPSTVPEFIRALQDGLRELGYVDGENIVMEYGPTGDNNELLRIAATELVRRKVDVLVAATMPRALAAKNATTTIPIVMVNVGAPVETGLVESLARPGGNVTGLSRVASDLVGKELELLREAIAGAGRVAVLSNSTNPAHPGLIRNANEAAASLGVQLTVVDARASDELDRAFAVIVTRRPNALLVLGDGMFWAQRQRLADLASKNRLPAIFGNSEHAIAGGLMSYAPSSVEPYRRAAAFIDKILRGAKPADLPIEQPTKVEFVINLKTAKALGLTIPPSLLLRADQVIE